MLLNQISFPRDLDSSQKQIDALKVLAFTDNVSVVYNAQSGVLDALVTEVRYLPEGVNFGVLPTDFVLAVKRQDAKSVNIVPLSTATLNEGLAVNETLFGGSTEAYFTNSYTVQVNTNIIRVGVSNFTQTVDNNPFANLLNSVVLYYQIT
jgi:hypothetical protein